MPGRWHKGAIAGLLVAASVLAGACGSSNSDDNPAVQSTMLDGEKVERAIERSSVEQRGVDARVSCPSGVPQEEGWVSTCRAVTEDGNTRFEVTQLDGSGHVHYEAQ
jgi:hypothetical protein